MEKKQKRTVREVSATPTRSLSDQTAFAKPKFQFGEEDASWLIGGVVEKGVVEKPMEMTKPPTAPVQTVLPFPVARHRAHGPHWAPLQNQMVVDEEGEGGDDNDGVEYDAVSAFAKPVPKKEKKQMNFNQLKELIAEEKIKGNFSYVKESEKRKSYDKRVDGDVKNVSTRTIADHDFDKRTSNYKGGVNGDSGSQNLGSVDSMEMDNSDQILPDGGRSIYNISNKLSPVDSVNGFNVDTERFDNGTPALPSDTLDVEFKHSEVKAQTTSIPGMTSSLRPYPSEIPSASMTLESEIDAENSARMQEMSPDEIAEAQLELVEKMNPSVIEALKKRGQKKLKEKQFAGTGSLQSTRSDNLRGHDNDKLAKNTPEGSLSETTPAPSPNQHESHSLRCSEPTSSSLWDTWSARVEAVRSIRFSLNGSVTEVDSSEPHGQIPSIFSSNAISVTERDFLRTEGDPGAIGYTILEAVELTRSVIPAQRALALHLLASLLHNAPNNILTSKLTYAPSKDSFKNSADWEAIWAFALGPEPKLVLALRLCMDDNQSNVILACLKVIQCVLSYEENESFFNLAEKTSLFEKSLYTAPIFRSKPDIDGGFLQGGHWKYSAKPSNIVPCEEDIITNENTEGGHKIQDDLHFAGQDVAGGLVRMGILPRICYLIEGNPLSAMEDCLVSVLIALARHSPKSASAIMRCPGLVQTIISRCSIQDGVVKSTKIKYVTLCKVLAQSDKKYCLEIIKNGNFHSMTWHLYRRYTSLDHWMKSGRDNCKLASAMMVEQLQFWKVCIQYGYCVSDFVDIFPGLCLWFNLPSSVKVIETGILDEFASISTEAFLVLGALAQQLPKLYHQNLAEVQGVTDERAVQWSWSHVGPVVDLALRWLELRSDQNLSQLFCTPSTDDRSGSSTSLLWVISAVLHMLGCVLEKIIPDDNITSSENGMNIPWLPDFVPKIGLQLLNNDFLNLDFNGTESQSTLGRGRSFVEHLCCLRQGKDFQTSLASVCCIYWFIQVIDFSDTLIQAARKHIPSYMMELSFAREDKSLGEGIVKSTMGQFRNILSVFLKFSVSEWCIVQSIEKFGRGGSAPGVGVGWGASGGGFWSESMILFDADSRVLIKLIQMLSLFCNEPQCTPKELTFLDSLNSVLGAVLTLGPRDDKVVDRAFDILLQLPSLKCLHHYVHRISPLAWEYSEEELIFFSRVLTAHFKMRWLSKKKKKKSNALNGSATSHLSESKHKGSRLEAISEEHGSSTAIMSSKHTSLIAEWTSQRLPLPLHWFLSPISTINIIKGADQHTMCSPGDNTDVISSGLFFLLGIEAASSFLPPDAHSPVQSVPLIWKLHSLSVVLLSGMDVLDEKSKHVYEVLQEMYGQQLDKTEGSKIQKVVLHKNENLMSGKTHGVESLRFKSEIHDSYPIFIEALVEQYAALSYGDVTYGRQIAMYLRRGVEASVRLSAWKELSNASILELLPPLSSCIGAPDGYLEPVEDDDKILEAYVKSWESGTLDKAAVHGSMAFALVLHHLSSFIFLQSPNTKPLLRSKLVKALLRDFCRKKKHQNMMLQLIRYNKPPATLQSEGKSQQHDDISIDRKFEIITEACEGNKSLLTEVDKLKSLCYIE